MATAIAREEKVPPRYGFGTRLRGTTMEQARAIVTSALAAEGFGVLTEIDVQATLEKKLGARVPPYLILGACNPVLARRALEIEPYVGLFLPCNVTLWQEGEEIAVTLVSPVAMMGLVSDERMVAIAREAEQRLYGALERIVT